MCVCVCVCGLKTAVATATFVVAGPNGLTVSGAECITDRAPPLIYPFPRQVPGLCCCVSSPLTFLLPPLPLLPKIDTALKIELVRYVMACYRVLMKYAGCFIHRPYCGTALSTGVQVQC